ncbi:O-antigen ligase family protein [Ramlibacter sp. XY19]|uniref:O-antigen ligase family protein n=1 Tax=Ramlibacter paludis TaxID=2908000 RepID=UPI0023D97F48|nr:O-antigen ligase family protein [Ramlibacter paludis]MCG2592024.1 O-antigen ligase family protein [Ramlibacter paludis]
MAALSITLRLLLGFAAFLPAIVWWQGGDLTRAHVLLFALAASVPLAIGVHLLLTKRPHRLVAANNGVYWLGIALFLLEFIALFRGWRFSESKDVRLACFGMLIYVTMIVTAIAALELYRGRANVDVDPFKLTLKLLGLYTGLNLALWALGMRNANYVATTEQPAQMLAYLGIAMNRVQLPLAWGVNNAGVIASATLTAGLIKFYHQRLWRDVPLLIAAPIITCVLADSRAGLVWAFACAVGVIAAPKLSGRALLVLWSTSILFVVGADYLPALTLGARDGATTFTNREIIWAGGIFELAKGKLEHIFGFGHYGQFESGAYAFYEAIFATISDRPELISLHNTYLQAALDIGYVGLGITVLFVFGSVKSLSSMRAAGWNYSAAQAVIMVLALNGITEVTLEFYQPWNALMLASIIPMLRIRENEILRR